jgi:3',5'-cyclic-AMP phosphodiesterase
VKSVPSPLRADFVPLVVTKLFAMSTRPTYRLLLLLFLLPLLAGAQKPFTFVFMTDIHVMPERNAEKGFQLAIKSINKEKPDFVITGCDLIYDALKVKYSRADSLYNIYNEAIKGLNMPVYNTIGNHEYFAVYPGAGADTANPLAGNRLFEQRVRKTCQTFMHNGWKFFLLNSVQISQHRTYYGGIDSAQVEWIKKELASTDSVTPIILVSHIPFRTVFNQVTEGAGVANDSAGVILNANQVLGLFAHHNLKLVLQGHQHYYEEIHVGQTWFVTAGSVGGAWWRGDYMGVPEGYLLLHVHRENVTWEYKTYGWAVLK